MGRFRETFPLQNFSAIRYIEAHIPQSLHNYIYKHYYVLISVNGKADRLDLHLQRYIAHCTFTSLVARMELMLRVYIVMASEGKTPHLQDNVDSNCGSDTTCS